MEQNAQADNRWMPEIREINLSYLMLAQSMVRSDKAQAMFSLGISEAVADMIMCRFRFDDEVVWSLLSEHGKRATPGVDANAARLHASIVMAGNFAEAV